MSIFGKDNTTTQQTTYPDFVSDAQKNIMTAAGGIAQPFIQPQQFSVAGQNEDQFKAAELARQSAMGAFNTDYSGQIAKAGQNGYTPAQIGFGGLGYNAGQITGDGIKSLMSPYLESVGRSTLGNMRRERDATDAQIGARSANGAAFGGSGAALERAQLNRGYGEQVGSTINSLLSGGFDRASALAGQNAQMDNAGRAATASANLSAATSNATMDNSARQYNSGLGLESLIAANSAANSTQDRQQNSLATLLNIGNQNQQYAQKVNDISKDNLAWYSQFVPGVQGSKTTTEPTNPLSTIIGLGSLASGLKF